MKKTIFRYGWLSIGVMLICLILSTFIFRDTKNFASQEVFGYISIVLSLAFVFFGIKHYRDYINQGQLSFGKGLQVGILISLFPSLLFAVFTAIYVTYINPDFSEQYYQAQLDQFRQSLPAEKFSEKEREMEKFRELGDNVGFQMALMFLTVFIIGFIITIISTLILRRSGTVKSAIA